MPFPPANPDPLLTDLADPHLSLHAVAAKHDTNLAALVLWMNAPEVAERLNQLRDACTARARLAATTFLPTCAHHLNAIVEAHMAEARAPASAPTNGPTSGTATTAANSADQPEPLALTLSRFRRLESARRAIASLIRIARWNDPRARSESSSRIGAPTHAAASRPHAPTDEPAPSDRFQTLVAALGQSWRAAIAEREQHAQREHESPSASVQPAFESGAGLAPVGSAVERGAASVDVPPVKSTNPPNAPRPRPQTQSQSQLAQTLPPPPLFRPSNARAKALLAHAGAPLNTARTDNAARATHDARAGPRWRSA